MRALARWSWWAALGALSGLWLAGAALAQDRVPVDLELLLAVDASSSVSSAEFDLQMRGLAEAFRHPAVIGAIRAAGDLGIAVSLIQWSDNRRQAIALRWTAVKGEASSLALSREIESTPRFLVGGGTAISGALKFAIRQFDRNGFNGRRKVIDLSGDGRANQGAQPSRMRDLAVATGITVNGLAILNEDQTVDRYYHANVIGGTGSFVMTADDYGDFARAMLEKLIKEIAGAPVARLATPDSPVLAAAPGPVEPPG